MGSLIPKIAYFYWTGGPLPWLREQSLVSFRRYHPDWEIVLGSPEPRSAPPGVRVVLDSISLPNLPPASRSDVWRWAALAGRGGLYADTDVIFIKSVEPLFAGGKDAWLTMDMGTPVWGSGARWGVVEGRKRPMANVHASIGVLGARPGSQFFTRLYDFAHKVLKSGDYQSHGTKLISTYWTDISDSLVLGNIPAQAFYKEGSSDCYVHRIWTRGGEFSPGEYGLHWYGGSEESKPYLDVGAVEQLPECWVRKALSPREVARP